MFTCSDQIQILAFDLVHHGIHLGKAHYAGNNIASDHKWRYAVCKSSVNHKIPGIAYYRRVKSCNITHKIIETVSRNTSCCIQVNTVEAFHDIRMIGYLKIGNHRLAVLCYLNVFRIILSYRNTGINDIRDRVHNLLYLFGNRSFRSFKLGKACSILCNLCLNLLGFFFFALFHKSTDLF